MKRKYRIIRSGRSTLSLEVTREGEVIVRAPNRCARDYIERFVAERQYWLERAIARQSARLEAHPEPSEAEREQYIARARAVVPERVEYFSGIMGLKAAAITITGARTSFGSCSGSDHLSFSWRLMQYPAQALDYVVVHELAHIVHKNHSRDFYALIESVLPDYRERIKLLKG